MIFMITISMAHQHGRISFAFVFPIPAWNGVMAFGQDISSDVRR